MSADALRLANCAASLPVISEGTRAIEAGAGAIPLYTGPNDIPHNTPAVFIRGVPLPSLQVPAPHYRSLSSLRLSSPAFLRTPRHPGL
ncbi:hypothetical protein B0H14DRAFT_3526214 [Mycena olivaceomarginata]|nr:hypothetical protein B0H14DRAFT_3526214 [Mycena olivaceomarginata]